MGVIKQLITKEHRPVVAWTLASQNISQYWVACFSHRSKPLWFVQGFPSLPRLMTPEGAHVPCFDCHTQAVMAWCGSALSFLHPWKGVGGTRALAHSIWTIDRDTRGDPQRGLSGNSLPSPYLVITSSLEIWLWIWWSANKYNWSIGWILDFNDNHYVPRVRLFNKIPMAVIMSSNISFCGQYRKINPDY